MHASSIWTQSEIINSTVVMTSITVYCDNSAAPHCTISMGADWTRVAVYASPGEIIMRLTRELPRVRAMLATLATTGSPPRGDADHTTIHISGPDADLADYSLARSEVLRIWGAAQPGAHQGADKAASDGATGLSMGSKDPEPAEPPNMALDDGTLVHEIAGRVMAQARRNTLATPDFTATRAGARVKAYNYIRSTAAAPLASDGVVEAVRKLLAS